MTILLFFFAFAFALYTSPVYAGHCAPGQTTTTGPLNYYCQAGNQVYRDLSDCTHRQIDICQSGYHCEEQQNLTDPDAALFAKCVADTTSTGTPANDAAGLEQIEAIFKNVISVVVGLGFIVLLIMLISAGFKYLTSGGEPKAIASAHQTVTWALLGILFMAIAWLVLQLIHVFTGIDVTNFKVRLPE